MAIAKEKLASFPMHILISARHFLLVAFFLVSFIHLIAAWWSTCASVTSSSHLLWIFMKQERSLCSCPTWAVTHVTCNPQRVNQYSLAVFWRSSTNKIPGNHLFALFRLVLFSTKQLGIHWIRTVIYVSLVVFSQCMNGCVSFQPEFARIKHYGTAGLWIFVTRTFAGHQLWWIFHWKFRVIMN